MSAPRRAQSPIWADRDDLVARLLAVCGEAIGVRTGAAIEGLRPLQPAGSADHLVLGFDYVWSRGREPLVVKLFRSRRSPWAPEEAPVTKLRREMAVLHWLARLGWPAPLPLWHEDEGAALDAPVLLMPRLPGQPAAALWADPAEAAAATFRRLTLQLARLHALPLGEWAGRGRLPTLSLDVVLAMLGALTAEMGHPPTSALLTTLLALRPDDDPLPPALLHGDHGPANACFAHGEVSALVDWEGAILGDPRWEVADARRRAPDHAADALRLYERAAHPLAHMPFWDALVAVREVILRRWWAHAGLAPTIPLGAAEATARAALRRANEG